VTHTDLEDCDECDELRTKVRELEADYRHENEGRRAIEALYTEQKARAEKAEARVAELEADYGALVHLKAQDIVKAAREREE